MEKFYVITFITKVNLKIIYYQKDPRHFVGDLLLAGGLARQIADPGECLGTRRHAQDQVKDDEHPGRGPIKFYPKNALAPNFAEHPKLPSTQ